MYYKKLNTDGNLNMIGTQETLPSDVIEITESEYNELYKYIQDNAERIVSEEDVIENE